MTVSSRVRRSAVIAICTALSATTTLADTVTESVYDVAVEAASAEAAPAGGATRLRFMIANNSPETMRLLGVRSVDAASGELNYFTHHGPGVHAETMMIGPDEELDFGTSHLMAELRDLTISLRPGDDVPFELVFDRGALKATAHVH